MAQVKAYIKNLRISPKKLRFLLPAIKKLKPNEALDYLFYTPKKGGKIFYKALKSALSNAKNILKVDENLLKFKLLTVEEGYKLKRYRSGGRGTVKPIVKRMSHIKIVLEASKIQNSKTQLPKKSQVSSSKTKTKK